MEYLSYDQAIKLVGGFSKFQWISSAFTIFGYLSGSYIFYGIPFLTVYPDY